MSRNDSEEDSEGRAAFHFTDNIFGNKQIQMEIQKSIPAFEMSKDKGRELDLDKYEAANCTFLKYFGSDHKEKGFYCTQCNPERNVVMCEYCYNTCHKDCPKLTKVEEIPEPLIFVCYCGAKLKHEKAYSGIKKSRPCKLLALDKRIGYKTGYKCESHPGITICSVCAKECHKDCKGVTRSNEDITVCQCEMKINHNNINEFSLNYALKQTNKYVAGALCKNLFPIQVINLLFDIKVFKNLIEFIKIELGIIEATRSYDKYRQLIPKVVHMFSDVFGDKFKTYYYHADIEDMFKFQNLRDYISKMDVNNFSSLLLKFRLLFILLFIHLKKDFQILKAFTSSDFISGSILERILYKKMLLSNTIFTEDLTNKYQFLDKNSDKYLNGFIIKHVCEFMREAIYSKFPFSEFSYEFEVGIKFLCFLAKHMMFRRKEIEKISEELFKIQDKFLEIFEADIEGENNYGNIFQGIVELCILLSVNYNDVAIFKYLNANKKNRFDPNDECAQFIHSKNEAGENLFKMIVKNSKFIAKSISKNRREREMFSKKLLIEFEYGMQLFTIVDNFYYDQLRQITEEDLDQFYDRMSLFEDSKTLLKDVLVIPENKEEAENNKAQVLNFNKQKVIPLTNKDTMLETKMSIEIAINNYFNKANEAFDQIDQELQRFKKKLKDSLNYKYSLMEKSIEEKKPKTLQEKERNDYLQRVLNNLARHFPNITELQVSNLDDYLELFMFSNFDETIFKILILFSARRAPNKISYEVLDLIYTLLSFFFISKKGFGYFLIGKNFTRLHKIFNRFRLKEKNKNVSNEMGRSKASNMRFTSRTLEFLALICKGMQIFNIQFKGNKTLSKYRTDMIEHFELYLEQPDLSQDDTAFMIQLNLCMEIFLNLRNFYSIEDFEEIKGKIWEIFVKAKFSLSENPNFLNSFELGAARNNTQRRSFRGGLLKDDYSGIQEMKNDLIDDILEIESMSESESNALRDTEVNAGNAKISEIKINLYSHYFRIMTFQTYCTNRYKKDPKCMDLPDTTQLDKYRKDLSSLKIPLEIRRTFLNMLRVYYFMDSIDEDDIEERDKSLSTKEYVMFEKSQSKLFADKVQKIELQGKVIDIFIQELEIFPSQLESYRGDLGSDVTLINAFIFDLLINIKVISNFYYHEKDIWNQFKMKFYLFIRAFAAAQPLIKKCYHSITTDINNINPEEIFRPRGEADIEKNKNYKKLCSRIFDTLNVNSIYEVETELMKEIEADTEVEKYGSLESFLVEYDTLKDFNFSPPSFINTEDFEVFYSDDKNEEVAEEGKKEENALAPKESILDKKKSTILMNYTDQFINVENTNFYEILGGVFNESDQFDYRKELFKYFSAYIKQDKVSDSELYYILCIIDKIIFYDYTRSKDDILDLLNDSDFSDEFFKKINALLHHSLVHCYITCKNISVPSLFLVHSNVTKLILQFLELLGDGYKPELNNIMFKKYQYERPEKIVEALDSMNQQDTNNERNKDTKKSKKEKEKEKNDNKKDRRKTRRYSMSIDKTKESHEEKKKSNEMNFYEIVTYNLKSAYGLLNLEHKIDFEVPFDKLIVLSNNLIDVITSYIDVTGDDSKTVSENISKLFNEHIFKCLLLKSRSENKLRSNLICFMKSKFLALVASYFQKSKNNDLVKQFTRTLSPSQLFEEILHHMQTLFKNMKNSFPEDFPLYEEEKFVNRLIEEYIYNQEFRSSLQFNLCLQYFTLIKMYEDVYNVNSLEEHFNKISKLPDVKKDEYNLNTKFAYKIRLFLNKIILKVQVSEEKEDESDHDSIIESFFLRPYVTFHLSNQTIEMFTNEVDRSSATSKLNELFFYSDFFTFEMATNARLLGRNLWSKLMRKILFKYVELISYLFLVTHNVLMLFINYKTTELDDETYDALDYDELFSFDKANLILAIVQAVYLFVAIVLYFIYKFPLYYEMCILKKTGKKFMFKRAGQEGSGDEEEDSMQLVKDYFDETKENIGVFSTINKLNSNIGLWKQVETMVFDSILANRQISMILLTFIFLIAYFISQFMFCLSFPLVFVFNLNPTLYSVYSSVKDHLKALLSIVLMMIILCYNFMWFSLHFMRKAFINEVYDRTTGEYIEEQMCSSPLQCLLHIFDYFIGGYSVDLDRVSYKDHYGYYMMNFFYDLIFFIVVCLIMYNVFLGVLYDTFSELRIQQTEQENDIRNVCFICQMTRDNSLAKGIDFQEHCSKTHDLWNYVYFMIYLHMSDANEFDSIQDYVWHKMLEQNNCWIPRFSD